MTKASPESSSIIAQFDHVKVVAPDSGILSEVSPCFWSHILICGQEVEMAPRLYEAQTSNRHPPETAVSFPSRTQKLTSSVLSLP